MTQKLTDDQKYWLQKASRLVDFTVEWNRGEQPCRNLAAKSLPRLVEEKQVPGRYPHTRARHWTYSRAWAPRSRADREGKDSGQLALAIAPKLLVRLATDNNPDIQPDIRGDIS